MTWLTSPAEAQLQTKTRKHSFNPKVKYREVTCKVEIVLSHHISKKLLQYHFSCRLNKNNYTNMKRTELITIFTFVCSGVHRSRTDLFL